MGVSEIQHAITIFIVMTQKKNPNYICQRFTSCDSTHSFTQGDGGHIYGKPWSIMATDAYCNEGELPPRSQGKTPSGKHASQGACQEWCVGDTTCNYYLYRYDPKKNPNYICQRFTSCDSTHSFTQGDGGHIYGKPWSIMATDAYCNKGELPPRSQGKTP